MTLAESLPARSAALQRLRSLRVSGTMYGVVRHEARVRRRSPATDLLISTRANSSPQSSRSQSARMSRSPAAEAGGKLCWRDRKRENVHAAIVWAEDVFRRGRDERDPLLLPIRQQSNRCLEEVRLPFGHERSNVHPILVIVKPATFERQNDNGLPELSPGELMPGAPAQPGLATLRAKNVQGLAGFEQHRRDGKVSHLKLGVFVGRFGVALRLWERMETYPMLTQGPAQKMTPRRNLTESRLPPGKGVRTHVHDSIRAQFAVGLPESSWSRLATSGRWQAFRRPCLQLRVGSRARTLAN